MRWEEYRHQQTQLPETEYEALVYLDNARWHLKNRGAEATGPEWEIIREAFDAVFESWRRKIVRVREHGDLAKIQSVVS